MNVETDEDGTTWFRDGEWRLAHTGPTVGEYRVFDGWWRPSVLGPKGDPLMVVRRLTRVRDSAICRCVPGPYVLATFHNERLVAVTRKHNRLNRDGSPQNCSRPPEQLDPVAWYEGRA